MEAEELVMLAGNAMNEKRYPEGAVGPAIFGVQARLPQSSVRPKHVMGTYRFMILSFCSVPCFQLAATEPFSDSEMQP
jgi:hypothetical protein